MKKNYFKKSVLAVAMALIGQASWAQTPFLTVNVPAEATYPYELTQSADVFAKEELTILLDVTMPASGDGVLISASDVTQDGTLANDNTSTYVAYGVTGANFRCFASAKSGGFYTGKDNVIQLGNRQYVTISMSKANQSRLLYVNTVVSDYVKAANAYQDFHHFADNANAAIFVGGGKTSTGDLHTFGGTVHAVEFYEGIYTGTELLNAKHKLTEQEVSEALTAARNWLNNYKGVGYPNSGPRATLSAAIEAFEQIAQPGDGDLSALNAAVDAYLSTSDVQMPEDGKAYVFTNVHPVFGERFLFSLDGVLSFETRNYAPLNELPTTATFICHQLEDGRYMFVNDEGKYMIWKGSNDGYNDNKGFVDAYDPTYCPMTFHKMTVNGGNTGDATNEDLFGLLCFGGKRKTEGQNSYFLTSNNHDPIFNQDSRWVMRYSTEHSTAFKVEEVPYANTVKMQSDGTDAYATLWLPFATEVPEGVNAYTAQVDDTGEYLLLFPVEGTVPAGEAVVLKANGKTSDFDAVFVPSPEAPARNAFNKLRGNALKIYTDMGGTVYVLGNVDGSIGFYRYTAKEIPAYKAYFYSSSIVATNKLNFSFGETTAIEGVQTAEKANAPIYDLSGRRVTKTVKGGIYIQNGQKFMVK